MPMEYSVAQAIRLVAQDLRAARERIGITSNRAARRAGLAATYYRALEKADVPKTDHVLRKLVSVCQRMDMASARIAYIDEIDQYLNLDLSSDPSSGRIIVFRDTLEANAARLHDLGCFLSPDTVFGFLERVGFQTIRASTKREDKQLVELLSACVLTMCLDSEKSYYVRPVKDDPPDVELQGIERDGSFSPVAGVEITQYGKHSASLFEVIGKKLVKRYQKGTMLVVMVEETETVDIAEIDKFIRNHNPHGQRLVVIGGTGQPGKFLAVPWDHVTSPAPGETDWTEIEADQAERGTGFRGYRGVFSEPTGWWRRLSVPLFVKEVVLNR